jgi:hypothetical protein
MSQNGMVSIKFGLTLLAHPVVGFVVDREALGQAFFSEYCGLPLSLSPTLSHLTATDAT